MTGNIKLNLIVVCFLAFILLDSCKSEKNKNIELENSVNFDEDVFENKKNNPNQTKKDKQFLANFQKEYWDFYSLWGGFLVARNGQIIYENYSGFFDKEKQIKNNFDKSIHIASISKVLTATLILKLIEANVLELNQKITTLFPTFPYPDIAIKTLLNHRSGLVKYGDFTSDKTIWDKSKFLSNKDVLALLIKHKPDLYFTPNTKFTYSNTNYVLLALIIEKVTNKTYSEALKHYLFEPLKMNHSFVYSPSNANKAAKSYYYGGNKLFQMDYLDLIYGDKNIYSTPRDLLKLDKALYSNKFLSKALKDSAYKGYSYESSGVKNYGLGMRMMEWEDGKKILYHNGWWHGNNTVYVRIEKDSIAIIALGNKYSNKVYDAFDLIGYFSGYPFELKKN